MKLILTVVIYHSFMIIYLYYFLLVKRLLFDIYYLWILLYPIIR